MKKIAIIICLFLCALTFNAQSISVSSFKLLDTDLSANTDGTMEIDQNGETAALIKVVTTQTGFTFDGGAMGIVKTKQTPGEVWVYIPRGAKKISIKHPQLGVLRDYYFPIAIEAARTYEMILIAGEVQTVVKQARTSQYVVFQLTPPEAVVELNGELLKTEGGVASKMMKFGTYNYRVQAPDYLLEAGSVTIDDPNNKKIVNVSLKPNYAHVIIKVENNAEIWVNGEKRGEGYWAGNLGAGTYEMEAKKQGHRSTIMSYDIEVASNPQNITLQPPSPIYGEVDINSSPGMADIYIDGNKVGQTPMLLQEILEGNHSLRVCREGYKDYVKSFIIKEGETESISFDLEKVYDDTSIAHNYNKKILNNLEFQFGNKSFKLIYVEGGEFFMGPKNLNNRIKIPSYYIGETEVTQALWSAVMGQNPSSTKGDDLPIHNVSWKDCQDFILKLNKLSGKNFRLPYEAEWEFAAKGGNLSQNNTYSGSNDINLVSWYYDNSNNCIHYVRNRKPNELGIYDMSGNVWEWCQDWYSPYTSTNRSVLHGATYGDKKVYRGGSYNLPASYHDVIYRNSNFPSYRVPIIGFRLALSVE